MPVEPENKHVNALIENVGEVGRLRLFRAPVAKTAPAAVHDHEILHKSSIVLLVACWEAFVEDLVTEALCHLVASSTNHKKIPKNVLERISSTHTGMKMWELAGDGWKSVLKDNLKSVLAKTVGVMNTPRTAQVDELFQKTIGLEKLSSNWKWDGFTVEQASSALDDLITLRGSIAHRVTASRKVELNDVKDARSLVYCLAVRSHNTTTEFLKAQVGSTPWKRIKFGTIT